MRIRPSELSRRAVLSGLAAATASSLAQPALAVGPMANAQVPAAYRFKLGGFECTMVSDGPLKLGTFTAEMFKGITQERIDEILADNFLDKNNFVVEQNALVVNNRREARPDRYRHRVPPGVWSAKRPFAHQSAGCGH